MIIRALHEIKSGYGGADALAKQINPSSPLSSGLTIKAATGNSDIVYIGAGNVSITTGFELSAGEELFIAIDNASKVYVVANPSQNEQQLVTYVSGAANETFKLSFEGEITTALAYDAAAATVETAFELLSTVGAGNGTVTGSAGGPWTVEFTGDFAGLDKEMVVASEVGVNEIQTITYSGNAAGDTYTLTFDGRTTAELNIDDNNTVILAALDALSNIESGDVVLSGGPAPGTPVIVTFGGQYLRTDAAAITGSGGTDEEMTITLTATIAGDTFDITYDGQTTSMIAYDATASTVQAALEALSNIAVDDVIVTGSDGGPFTLVFGGLLGETDLTEITGTCGTNEVQTVLIDTDCTGGTFTLTFGAQETGNIAYDADAATVDTALELLSSINVGEVTVTGGPGPATAWVVEFTGTAAQTDVGDITADGALLSGRTVTVTETQVAVAAVNEVQTVSIPDNTLGGTFTLDYDGQETGNIAYDADAATVDAALENLSNIGVGDVAVTGGPGPDTDWIVEFTSTLAGAPQVDLIADGALLSGADVTVSETQGGSGSQNEIQTISIPNTISDGTLTLTYNGQTTGTIAYNANAATVKSTLEALTNIEVDDVAVTGGPGPGTDWIVEFQNNLGLTDLVLMAGDGTNLVGRTASVVETTPGVSAVNEQQTINIPDDSAGGSFTLSFDGQGPTGAITYDDVAADIKTALELLSNIDTVAVTGGDGPASDWVVEFQGTNAATDVALMTADSTLLLGGTPVIAQTTPGNAGTFTPATTVAGNELTVGVAETQKGVTKTITITESQESSAESKYSWIGG